MKLRRQKTEPNRRQQRQRVVEDAPSKMSSFAYSSRQTTTPNRPKSPVRHVSFWAQRIGLLIFIVALAVSSLNVLSLSSTPHVITLSTDSNRAYLQSDNVYQTAATKILQSSIWNHSKLTVDANGLSHHMLQQFPELSSASVTIPLLAHRPIIYIEPAQPALVLAASNGSFIVDTDGKALVKTDTSISTGLPTLTDQSGSIAQVNHQVLPAADVKFIQIVIAELAAKQATVTTMSLPPASAELDVSLAGQAYFVKFNLQNNDPAEQAGTFLATAASLKTQNITPAHYIDVRVDGRAYYQ